MRSSGARFADGIVEICRRCCCCYFRQTHSNRIIIIDFTTKTRIESLVVLRRHQSTACVPFLPLDCAANAQYSSCRRFLNFGVLSTQFAKTNKQQTTSISCVSPLPSSNTRIGRGDVPARRKPNKIDDSRNAYNNCHNKSNQTYTK